MSLMFRDLSRSRLHLKTNRLTALTLLTGSYALWSMLFRLAALTFVIYFLTHTSSKTLLFEEVNETFGAHELSFVGFGALIFALFCKGLSPFWGEAEVPLFTAKDFRKDYLVGIEQGALLACALIAAFLAAGTFRYVGFFVQLEETPLAVFGIVIRAISLIAFCYCEEWIFRRRAFDFLLRNADNSKRGTLLQIGALGLAYCVVKALQFELGWMHLLTLFLLSTLLSLRRITEGGFGRGAGIWCGLLLFFQPLCSLPVLGNDFSGIFLVKYQEHSTALRLFSGGEGGPLSGFALQLVLLIETVRSLSTYLKNPSTPTRA